MIFESQLVVTIIKHPELINSLTVTPSQFEDKKVSMIFSLVLVMASNKVIPDDILIAETLNGEHGDDWMPIIMAMYRNPIVPANLIAYENIILMKYKQRQVALVGANLIADQKSDSASYTAINALNLLDQSKSGNKSTAEELVTKVMNRVDDCQNGKIEPLLQTGIRELDSLSGGLAAGDSIVVAARTSVGKTAFMCNLAYNVNCPCGVISGEQSGDQVMSRILSRVAHVSSHRLKTGELDSRDNDNLFKAAAKLSNENQIYVIDKSRPSIEYIEAESRKLKAKHDIKILFIDYLQLITNNAYPEKRLQVSDISQRVKALAQELEIPVVILAQLNRGAAVVDRMPVLSDLKESGAIEEDADIVILLSKSLEKPHEICVDVQKNRNGGTGHFPVGWDGQYMAITNMENRYDS